MTGFLQRLAARAIGVAHPARAVSVAPFAPAPELLEATSRLTGKPVLTNIPDAMHGQFPRVSSRAKGNDGPGTSGDQATAQIQVLRNEASETAGDHSSRSDRMARQPVVAPATAEQTADLKRENDVPPAMLPPVDDEAPRRAGEMPSGFSPSDHMPGKTGTKQSTPTQSVQPAMIRVERLLPLAARETRDPAARFSPGLDYPGQTRAGTVEETTEVHVSIGRIEVTAVHEPAPAKPAASRRNAPMSLDDYLAKRHGGRP